MTDPSTPAFDVPRIPPLKDQFPDKPNLFATMAHHPKLAEQAHEFATVFLRNGGLLSPRHRELAILRTAARLRSEYEFAQHIAVARTSGLTDDEIRRAVDTSDRSWTGSEAVLLDAADEVFETGDVSDGLWSEMEEVWSVPQILELLALFGMYRTLAIIIRCARVQVDEGADRWSFGAL